VTDARRRTVKLSFLWQGLPGHPIHPPLTDATLGTYTFATIAAVLYKLGVADDFAAAWWLALVVGLVLTAPTALTGVADWRRIESGTPLNRTATAHGLAMVTATVCFLVAAVGGHGAYVNDTIGPTAFVVTLVGFGVMTLGGWLGGAVVYVHGMRVLQLVEEPSARAVSPAPKPEKEAAEGS
jgi:uncharacterized membrane protein